MINHQFVVGQGGVIHQLLWNNRKRAKKTNERHAQLNLKVTVHVHVAWVIRNGLGAKSLIISLTLNHRLMLML